MKIKHYPETDSMMISLNDNPSAETIEINAHINIDLDKDGKLCAIDIHNHASAFNLNELEIDLPKLKQKLG